MKAKKAFRRLAKIDALISDVAERFSETSVPIREALQDAKAAFAHLKKTVRLQVSSQNAKRAGASKKKVAVKVKTPTGRTAKKSAPVEKAVKAANGRMASPAHMATSPLAVR